MSSFNSQNKRQSLAMTDKKVKAHVKEFYKIMDDMQKIAEQLDPSIEYNEENINDYVKPIYRALDEMEIFLVLGKLHHLKEHNKRKDFYEREDNHQ